MENKKRRSLREEWGLIWRGVGIIKEIMPGYWAYNLFCILLETFSPYFGLFMSAQLVNELAGACRIEQLLLLAAVTAGGGFLISVAVRILRGRRGLQENDLWSRIEGFYVDAQNHFQYEHLENPDVVLKRAEINAVQNAFGAGLMRITWSFGDFIRQCLEVGFSASLTVSLLVMTVKGEFTGILRFINSPWAAVLLVVLIAVKAVFSMKSSTKFAKNVQEIYSGLAEANTRMLAYMKLEGADMLVFDLNRMVNEEFRKTELRPAWVDKYEKLSIRHEVFTTVSNAVFNILVFLFVAAKAFIGTFGIGNFILYQGTVSRFIDAIARVAEEAGLLLNNNEHLVKIYEYLDLPNDMYKGTLAVEKRDDIDYEIEFRDVSFKYPRTESWALRHVNMKFKIGDKLAIVGENGSGKTTFIKLLCRLYDPTEGTILLNGIDITRYRYEEYMELFSVVFQDYTMFEFPLGENVAALQTYDEKKVRECLVRAGMGEKLESLDADAKEKGYDPLKRALGSNYEAEYIQLSGGEQQKVALARALYKNAPFVILDEPTAALDPIAEAAVYENFNAIVKEKTAVFISHRLSSCRFCDEIAVFDKGELVQLGNHDALVAGAGKYRMLWNAQAKYYGGTVEA